MAEKVTNQRKRIVLAATAALLLTAVIPLIRPQPANAVPSCAYFDFDKGTNINSTLTWKWYDNFGRCLYSNSWRAGSGKTTDPCQSFQGWLPNGWYDSPSGMRHQWQGQSIWGRVWTLQNKQCSNGTWRTELFIHTEETIQSGQSCSGNADDPQCWDSSAAPGAAAGTNDFYSEGCIKVRRASPEGSWPDAMSAVHSTYHGNQGSSDGTSRANLLNVHS
jgi:hypothetical protein